MAGVAVKHSDLREEGKRGRGGLSGGIATTPRRGWGDERGQAAKDEPFGLGGAEGGRGLQCFPKPHPTVHRLNERCVSNDPFI